MKEKGIIIIWLLIASIGNVLAQDKAMAKAFFEKARQAYATEDWKAIIKNLEKTKEYLGGASNPDIMYLEAKARYKSDININLSKELFKRFLKEASPTDSRKDEVARILADIEGDEDNYYYNGNRKTYEYINDDKNKVEVTFNVNGRKILSKYYYGNTESVKRIVYYISNRPMTKIFYNKDGTIYFQSFYDENEQRKKVNYYKDGQNATTEVWVPAKVSKDSNGYELIENVEIPKITNELEWIRFYYKGQLRQQVVFYSNSDEVRFFNIYDENGNTFKVYDKNGNIDKYLNSENSSTSYRWTIMSYHSNGLVKEMKFRNIHSKFYRIFSFTEKGEPLYSSDFTLGGKEKKDKLQKLFF